ncbi:MAG: hydantoinase, partial [Actinomycetota bacterium]
MPRYDLVIKGANVVRAGRDGPERLDIAVSGEQIVALLPDIDPNEAADVVEADGLLAFPGAVDSHCHWGIYNSLEQDAKTESRAAAQGGTTTAITYIRTGQYYL